MENTQSVKLPDGNTVTIRETNGEDEGILTKTGNLNQGIGISMYVTSLLMGKYRHEEVLKWKINSTNYLLIAARIFSYGHELNTNHICTNPDCRYHKEHVPSPITIDLRQWGWPLPEGEVPNENFETYKYIKPYPNEAELYLETTMQTGKKIRLKSLNGEVQSELMKIAESDFDKNSDLLCRELSIFNGAGWDRIASFKSLSGREMMEIRKLIKDNEPEYDLTTQVICSNCKKSQNVSILTPDFFYPTA